MKKILILIILLILPITVYGYYEVTDPNCTVDVKTSLRESTSDIVYIIEKYKENIIVYYKISMQEIPENIKITDETTNITYGTDSTIYRIVPGSTKILRIYANTNSPCNGYNVYTKIITIPYYNIYSGSILCNGNEEYYLCKENINTDITESEFETLINKYILEKETEEEKEEDPEIIEEESIFRIILKFIYANYIYILISVIVLGTLGIIITLIVKKKRNNF